MGFEEIKNIIIQNKSELVRKYHLKDIGIFGSYARNEQTSQSDVDILVDFTTPVSLFDFIDLEEDISFLLNLKVDLVSRKALKPYIGRHILNELKPL